MLMATEDMLAFVQYWEGLAVHLPCAKIEPPSSDRDVQGAPKSGGLCVRCMAQQP